MQHLSIYAILFQLLYSVSTSQSVYCYDDSSCQDLTISGSYVYCYGYDGCFSATSITATGHLYCGGYRGCYDSGVILATSSVHCIGYYSCYSATSITGSYINCAGQNGCYYSPITSTSSYVVCRAYYACYGGSTTLGITAATNVECSATYSCGYNEITATSSYVLCRGYQSCYGTTSYGITASSYVECSATYACGYRLFITSSSSYVRCDGYRSCYYIYKTGISADTTIECRGYESCRSSKLINANDGVYCEGTLSCAYSQMRRIVNITATGANSLNYANITSLFVTGDEMTVNLYGWQAGYKLSITCDPGHTCYINCAGNGCNGTELIYNYGTFIIDCDESMNIYCPNGYYGPTPIPTFMPVSDPSKNPTKTPTLLPSPYPTKPPTDTPTEAPTDMPTPNPTHYPTNNPTDTPTTSPTEAPISETGVAISSSEDNTSTDTIAKSFGDIGLWLVIIMAIIIIALIIIVAILQTNNKNINKQLESTKQMLLSEQSEMLKALSKSHGTVGAANIANFSGMSTDSMIPQQPAQHANLIQQWASTNGPQQPFHQQVYSGSVSPRPQMGGIQMSTLAAQKQYHLAMANALNNPGVGGEPNKVNVNNNNNNNLGEGLGNGGIGNSYGYGEMVLPKIPNVDNKAIELALERSTPNDKDGNSDDDVEIDKMYHR